MWTLICCCHLEIFIIYMYGKEKERSKISKTEISSDLAIAIFFPSTLIITFESHIRNATYMYACEQTAHKSSWHAHKRFLPSTLGKRNNLETNGQWIARTIGRMYARGITTVDFHPQCAKDIPRKGLGDPSIWDGALRIWLSSTSKDDWWGSVRDALMTRTCRSLTAKHSW